jgi:ribosome-associated translation inhibitor RaiA
LLDRHTMKLPVQITYRDMSSSPAIEQAVHERIAELERVYDRITSCRVMIEAPHHQHRKGNLFHVRIDLTVPGDELVVGRNPAAHHAHEDFNVALRDAFRAARRALREHARIRRGDIKNHSAPTAPNNQMIG